jgi:uncharacterized protein (DUF885 family)
MKIIPLLGLLAALASPALAGAQDFDAWAEGVATERMRMDPAANTTRQYLPAAEQEVLDGKLTPNTSEYRADRIARARAVAAELAAFDRQRLTPVQRTSAAVMAWSLKGTVDSEPFEDFDFVFNQFRGLHVSLVNFLSQVHPVRNTRDIENYLARLEQVAGQIDTGIQQAKAAASRGFLMPRFITEASIRQFDTFLADSPANNVLVASLDQRASRLSELPAPERAKFVARAQEIVLRSVIPAFGRAQALLKEQLPRTSDDAGLWRLPGGDKAYAFELRRNTTTDYTATQIHQLGLREVARIEAEMDALLRRLGYADGNIKQRMAKLEADSQPKADDPRAELLARYDSILRDAEQRAKQVFEVTPKAPVEVRREPAFTEKTAAAHYSSPAKDGSRPGVFWAPLPGAPYEIVGMRTLVYHEAVPGHHFQVALQQEEPGLPRYRRDFVFAGGPAYSEGWALYAEQLAVENNWYADDLVGHLGQLSDELFRARRLVVDTGLHAMKWTRQQAIDYGIPPAEVDRYVVMPGQACAYKIGMLRILELRAKAQKELGGKFDIKKFHALVLKTGNVPLAVLQQVVDDWIVAMK